MREDVDDCKQIEFNLHILFGVIVKIIRCGETFRGCCMAVNILGKFSAAHLGLFEQGKNPRLDEELVVNIERQLERNEKNLLNMPSTPNNLKKIEALHSARNGVRAVIGAPLLPELSSQHTQELDDPNLGVIQRLI